MRVLHVAESIKGGCGTYLDQIVPPQLRDPAISGVRVIVPDAHAAQVASIPADILRPFPLQGRSLGSFRSLAATVWRETKAFRPDVIHLHSTFAGLIGRPLMVVKGHRPRIVYCAHGWAFDMERDPWKLKAVALLERAMAPLADRIVAISDYERRRGIEVGIAADRITTIWNGVADRAPPPPPAPMATPGDRLKLLFIGRLDRQKGYDTLFDAVDGLGDRIDLRMIGSSVVGDQAGQRALPPHVSLLGWKTPDEIADELAWADLVVVPSRWEGFGLVALEAMRAGRAVLASNVGGLPEVVADGVTGRLIPADDATALRTAILGFDAPTLVAMGAAGRRRFTELFTIDRTVAGLTAVYRAAGA